jgi:CheY-like chemotaxis protein
MKPPGTQAYQILVVDDEPTVRRAIKMLLKFDGHEVHTADSGEAALTMFDQGKFDLIITDHSMQGMKGHQLAALIKQRRPSQPVIMATAFAADFQTPGKPAAGVDCVLSKPFSLTELRQAITQVLPQTNPGQTTTSTST